MKQRKLNRLLCILLSAALLATGTEFPVSAAAEEEPLPVVQLEESVPEIPATEDAPDSSSDDDRPEVPADEPTADLVFTDPADSGTENTQDTAGDKTAPEEDAFSDCQFVVNPIYEDVLDQTQLQARLDALQDGGQIQAKGTTRAASLYQSVETAAEYVRGELLNRSTSFSFSVPSHLFATNQKFGEEVFDTAMAYTRDCTGQEGDALLYGLQAYQAQVKEGTGGLYTLNCTVLYHSDAAQEAKLTEAVDKALAELALTGKSDYEKVRLIHDYICDHVEYDETYGNYSAYHALCEGSAVCQGYAVLFYRMCKDAGLSVRILSGTGNGEAHGWNIVQIGSKYYNIDCTWDDQSTHTIYDYFLKSDAEFGDHVRDERYTAEEFLSAYPVASASYTEGQEEDSDSGLGLDNPDYDFISIEGNDVSSAAQGKPKVLIFYKTNCTLSQASIRSVAQRGFPDVDILAIETTGQSKDSVISFKNTYTSGNNDILFTYDTYGVADSRAMWAYFDAAGNSPMAGATLPIICYIDANNKFQYLTTGSTSGDAMASNLTRYCNYGVKGETYTITYVLDGGTNDSANPATYTQASPVILLKDPVKIGYTFAGWYSDKNFSRKITRIGGGMTGNLTLYAKWEQSTDGLNLNNPEVSFTTIDGKTVTSKADQKPKLLIFFRTTCGYSRRTIKGIADHGFSDPDIYALEIDGRDKADVASFKDMYGSAQITFAYDTSGRYNTVLFQYLQVAGMYTSGSISITLPVICYIDADNKLQYISQGYQSADDISARLEQYCRPKEPDNPETSACRVTFDLQSHGTLPEEYKNGVSVEPGSKIDEPPTPEADGYTFTGWYKEPTCKNKWDFSRDSVAADTILYAGWQAREEGSGDVLPEDTDNVKEELWAAPIRAKYIYTGSAVKPKVRVYWKDRLLEEGIDYTVSYKNNVNAFSSAADPESKKAPTATIKGKGVYAGTCSQTFTIVPAPLNAVTAENLTVAANGKNQQKTPVLTYNGKKLSAKKDFTFKYADETAKEPGVYKMQIRGTGNYTGLLTDCQLEIIDPARQTLISKASVKKIGSMKYNGKAQEPTLIVKRNNVILKEGIHYDYTVTYKNNTEIGTATAVITGHGIYAGTKKVNFKITGTSVKKVRVTGIEKKIYNGGEQTQEHLVVTSGGNELKEGKNYVVSYAKNKNAGTASLTITGKGAYSGSVKKTFKIAAYNILTDENNLMKVTADTSAKYEKNKPCRPEPTVTYNGIPLVKGKDYTVSYKNNKKVTPEGAADKQKAAILIKGKGNFKGTLIHYFTITN